MEILIDESKEEHVPTPLKDLKLLEKLYFLNRLTSSRIARELKLTTTAIKRFFERVSTSYGIKVKLDVMQSKLGLKLVLMLLHNIKISSIDRLGKAIERIPYGKSLALIVPRALMVVLQIPQDMKIKEVTVKNLDVKCFDFVIRSKPHYELMKALFIRDLEFLLSKGLDMVVECGYDLNQEELFEIPKFDSLDLKILQILQLSPALTMVELAQELNSKVKKIELHIAKHAEKLILGYRVARLEMIRRYNNVVHVILLRCKDPLDFCRRLIGHPYVLSCTGSRYKDVALLIHAHPLHTYRFIHELTNRVESLNCEVVANFEYSLDKQFFISATLPGSIGVEYIPKFRWWSREIDLEHIIDVLKHELGLEFTHV